MGLVKSWNEMTRNFREHANVRMESERAYDEMLEELPKLDPVVIIRYREKAKPEMARVNNGQSQEKRR